MALIESEIEGVRKLRQQYADGKIDNEKYMALLHSYSISEKFTKLFIAAKLVEEKFGVGASRRILESNIVGNDACVDLGVDMELEKIKCADQNKIITREECLDYSGSAEHLQDCQSCSHFKISRRLLLPAK